MTPYRTGGPIHGRTPRTETPTSYRVPKPDVPDPSPGWQKRGACRSEDPELFFPVGNTGPGLLQIKDAKAVCHRCDVVDECLQWALESGQDHGVWGNASEDERRAMKRRAARERAKLEQAAA